MSTVSILWPRPPEQIPTVHLGAHAVADLELGPILAAVIGDRDDHNLTPLLHRPVRDHDTVTFRQQVFTDLDDDDLRAAAEHFAIGMWRVHRRLDVATGLPHPYQRHRWHLDAAADYVTTVTELHTALTALPLRSRALQRWRAHLDTYCAGTALRSLAADIDTVRDALAQVRYRIRLVERTLQVTSAAPATDYTATITTLLARFGAPHRRTPPAPQWPDMNQTEEQILDRVVARHRTPFTRLARFADSHHEFITTEIAEFERELHFYLRYRRFAQRCTTTTHRSCLPEIAAPGRPIHATGAYDYALAIQHPDPLVCNDFRLDDTEQILVVTGPNQGGKTTFARSIGQLIYFAALGGPVPARTARLPLPDRLFTHFERAEHASDPSGRLLAELRAMHDTLDAATAETIIVLNESFSTTGTTDGNRIAADVLTRIVRRGTRGVWVGFFDELADADPAAVSMVALTDPADVTHRSFRIVRRPADRNTYAPELARHYGLGYRELTARLAR